MKTTAAAPLFPEPTHDEIALSAFLLWEKEGRQSGCEMTCWLQAEAQLRALRLKKVATAAQPAKSWPTPSTAAPAPATKPAPKAKLPAASKLTTTVARATTVKAAPAAPGLASRSTARTSLRAAR